jgi:Protein of unknown function (DUF1236)
MKSRLFAGVAAIALLASGPSFGQGVGVQVGPVGAGITFAPEERTRIKEYVAKERVPRTVIKERVTVGGTVPADVELREVPSAWGPSVSRYRYFHTDTGVHFVDPSDRRVIYDLN